MSLIAPVSLDYQNYRGERLPHIGVFYVFPRFIDKGLCKEFKIDIKDLVHAGDEVISEIMNYEFVTLDGFLRGAERNKFQAIRTDIVPGVSFRTLANLVAQIHFQEFLNRHEWLRTN